MKFQKTILKINFFEKIDPKNPKNTPKIYKKAKNMAKKGQK